MILLGKIAVVGLPLIGKAVSIPLVAAVGLPVAVGVGATLVTQALLDDSQEDEGNDQ